MAKASLPDDDSKVMDVSKPGKGKIVTTSRPVIAPLTTDKRTTKIVTASVEDEIKVESNAPSASHKTIQPLTDLTADTDNEEPSTPELVEDKPEDAPVDDTDQEETEPKEDTASSAGQASEEAGVNALADSVGSKKQAAKKAEEQAKLDEELQELIDSKKYFVPVGNSKARGRKKSLVFLTIVILLVLAAASAYLLIDVGIIDADIELPVDLIK